MVISPTQKQVLKAAKAAPAKGKLAKGGLKLGRRKVERTPAGTVALYGQALVGNREAREELRDALTSARKAYRRSAGRGGRPTSSRCSRTARPAVRRAMRWPRSSRRCAPPGASARSPAASRDPRPPSWSWPAPEPRSPSPSSARTIRARRAMVVRRREPLPGQAPLRRNPSRSRPVSRDVSAVRERPQASGPVGVQSAGTVDDDRQSVQRTLAGETTRSERLSNAIKLWSTGSRRASSVPRRRRCGAGGLPARLPPAPPIPG